MFFNIYIYIFKQYYSPYPEFCRAASPQTSIELLRDHTFSREVSLTSVVASSVLLKFQARQNPFALWHGGFGVLLTQGFGHYQLLGVGI